MYKVLKFSYFNPKIRWFLVDISRKVQKMSTLESLKFDNLVLRRLPVDSEERNYVRTVSAACFSRVLPVPVDNPVVVAYSLKAMALLDLPITELNRKEFVEYFSGNKLLPGSEPAAHCYCGHQFGYFSGQLGDGAAMYLGEVINKKGERWEIQLKGAGPTPYSRSADGRKVLRSSIREFLCSEAMHFLGIPTTRAGSCITSDSEVIRDVFYDGHPVKEKCTIVLRIAQTFIRFGSFEIFKTLDPVTGRVGPSVGRTEILYDLINYVIETFYPEIDQNFKDPVEKYAAFFKEIVLRTARLVALWQSVGFCHGVLNTDNMSILGLTLDYGPFGFLDMYDPNHICNGSDDGGRYSFGKQPEICLWNLHKFAEAIQKALPLDVSLPLLELYETEFQRCYFDKMRCKFGLINLKLDEDKELIEELLDVMENTGADFTNTFCCFLFADASHFDNLSKSLEKVKENILKQCYPLEVLIKSCKPNMNSEQIQRIMILLNSNPEILDNLGRTGLTIKRMKLDIEKASKFEKMSAEDKLESDEKAWSKWLKKYEQRIKKEMVENSEDLSNYNAERLKTMSQNNPRFILRNHIAQKAIEKAELGDYSEVQRILKLLETPYDHSVIENLNSSFTEIVNLKYDSGPSSSFNMGASTSDSESKENMKNVTNQCLFDKSPDWAFSLKVT